MRHEGNAAIALLATGLAIAGCGSAGDGTQTELEQQVKSLNGKVASVESKEQSVLSNAEAAKVKTEDSRNAILDSAEGKAQKIVGQAKAEAQELEDVEGKIASKEDELAQVEESITGAHEEKVKSTISDGTWQLGVDYEAGTYRAPGGNLCSWEQDQQPGGEATGEGFNGDYGFAEKNILIEINAPYFKTQHCGTWQRVG